MSSPTSPDATPAPGAPPHRATLRRMGKFLLVGLGGYALLTFGVIALVEWVGLGKRPAYAIMISVVMVTNFYANRRFVFPAGRTGAPARQAVRFLGTSVTFRLLEFMLYSTMIGPFEVPYVAAIALTSALSYGVKYYVFSQWVFR